MTSGEIPFHWRVALIEFSGGDAVELDSGSVLVLIGPNSSGKSTALREIQGLLIDSGTRTVVIRAVGPHSDGDHESFRAWLRRSYRARTTNGRRVFHTKGGNLEENGIEGMWARGPMLSGAQAFLVHRLDTESRLVLANRTGAISVHQDQPQAYIHVLQSDETILHAVTREVRAAFGVDLIINWGGAGNVWFHVGDEPQRSTERDRVSSDYLADLVQLPMLEHEGDGLRSFVGTLLAAKCGNHPVLLVDEPEAFLHPPQARRIAALLARSARELNRQVIIATHSADVLQGALAEASRVSVCRLTRDGDVNRAQRLGHDEIVELWRRPILRSSSALDGVFHEGVVICEGDADARFYEAISRRIDEQGSRRADLYFLHGGGKGQLATLARAYRSLATRTAVIADLDLLREREVFRNLYRTLGGDFEQIEGLYNTVSSSLGSLSPETSVRDFLASIKALIAEVEKSRELSSAIRKEGHRLLDRAGDWSGAKRHGIDQLRGGDRRTARALLAKCCENGLFLVPAGEIESWWRDGPADKSEWFPKAIEELARNEGAFSESIEFMTRVRNWLLQ
jgi:energy-coupling factor transporter ATP-binding protein EcfA2